MAAPNVNGRLHLTGVHQKPLASFLAQSTFRMSFQSLIVFHLFGRIGIND